MKEHALGPLYPTGSECLDDRDQMEPFIKTRAHWQQVRHSGSTVCQHRTRAVLMSSINLGDELCADNYQISLSIVSVSFHLHRYKCGWKYRYIS